jgi:phospholipid/cholesterol/gamma-HCH transport system substrate-binding protein
VRIAVVKIHQPLKRLGVAALTDEFLTDNGDVLADDLALVSDTVAVVRRHQDSLEESFDTMPTMAENFAYAYDWELGRLRVQFSFDVGPFNSTFLSYYCNAFAGIVGAEEACGLLFMPDGSGLLDPVLHGLVKNLLGGRL